MKSIVRVILILGNIASLCIASIWAHESNYEFEPILVIIGLMITLVSFLKEDKKEDENQVESNIIKSVFVIVFLLLFSYTSYRFYCKVVLEKQVQLVTKVIQNAFSDDIEFIAGLLPVICDSNKEVEKIYTKLRYEKIDFSDIDPILVNEVLRILKRFPSQLKSTEPKNSFQKHLKEKLLDFFETNNVTNLKFSESRIDEFAEKVEKLGENFMKEFSSLETKTYVEDKIAIGLSSIEISFFDGNYLALSKREKKFITLFL